MEHICRFFSFRFVIQLCTLKPNIPVVQTNIFEKSTVFVHCLNRIAVITFKQNIKSINRHRDDFEKLTFCVFFYTVVSQSV